MVGNLFNSLVTIDEHLNYIPELAESWEAQENGAVGAQDHRVLLRHILPNGMAPVIVLGTLEVATAIIVEAGLSFLGLGTQPPTPSWGWDLRANVVFIEDNPWIALFPGLAIFVTVLGFNLFGDGLRDALDPRLKQ